jgi:RNA polymerase sigma-70 factor, ECF subfamily
MADGYDPPSAPDPLLPSIAAGDASAIGECIRRYGGLVWTIARRFSATSTDAEDAVQEIFLDLWRSARQFDPNRGSERLFVTMRARRWLIDRLRSLRRQRSAEVRELDDMSQEEAPQVNRAERDVEVEEARKLLEGLPVLQQRIIAMSLVLGFSQSEIAEREGLPLGTVKSIFRRAILQLRADLTNAHKSAPDDGGSP